MRFNIKKDGSSRLWFAWYPVLTRPFNNAFRDKWVWLEKVSRRWVPYGWWDYVRLENI